MPPGHREATLAKALVLAAACTLAAAAARGQGLCFEGGISLGRGDYVYTQTTSSGGAAAGLAWTGGPLTVRATLPYFVRDTRLLTERDAAPTDDVQPATDGSVHEGSISDPQLQAAVLLLRTGRNAIGVSLSVKIPVVEAGAFGTGEWDVGAGVSLSHLVGGATMVGLDATWWHMGDPPDLPLRDTVMGTASVGRSLGRTWLVSASLSGGRSTLAGYADPWWAAVVVSRSFSGGIIGATASVGLTDSAADVTVGLVWRVGLGAASTR
jgi:hypothetical protein